jgi:hypoxanthine phosphoribosyltransferase
MDESNMRVLFDANQIAERVQELAAEIRERHPRDVVLFIGILKGAFIFLADLVRALDRPCQVDFARIASYASGSTSKGSLDIVMDCGISLEGRNVIVVDDIVDTGLTLSEYRAVLEQRNPRSIETAALLDKTARREKHVALDYCGFSIPDGFVVGYGLDFDERHRHLDGIYVLD